MLGTKKAPLLLALCAGALFGLATAPARAGDVTMTPVEWYALPDFCRPAILGSIYIQRVPFELRGNVTEGPKTSGGARNPSGIPGPHHFCYGLIHLGRAKRGAEKFDTAVSEFNYSYGQMNRNAPMFSYVSANLGRALYGQRKKADAAKVWTEAIALQPQRREAYLALAEALLGEHRADEALKVLLKYEDNKESDYPDAEHFLAQTYFDLKKYAEAKTHAERAYALGYPVFGLRDKLKQIGKW
jgi:tetratricopeptide (TPR) repeat protein